MKRIALILVLISLLPSVHGAETNKERDQEVRDLMNQAGKAAAAAQFDQALPLYEQVIDQYPEAGRPVFDAQTGIAQALAKKGDFGGALKAAHVALDGAPTAQAFDNAATLIANLFSARDQKVDQANRFIAWQQSGSGANPLEAIGYPVMTDREHAFEAIWAQAGNDAAAAKLRAVTYLYSGHPREALAQYAEAFRRNDNLGNLPDAGMELVFIGLRAARGCRAGLDDAMTYVVYGPNGPDGKPGTTDDLKDPFAGLLSPPPPAGQGGGSGIKPEDMALLNQIGDAAKLYAGDPLLVSDIRRSSFSAIQRVNASIDGWGAPGQRDWYFDLIFKTEGAPLDKSSMGAVLTGAELAARGRDPHYGGVWTFWSDLDAANAAASLTSNKEMEDARSRFKKMCDDLLKQRAPSLVFTPLKEPAKF